MKTSLVVVTNVPEVPDTEEYLTDHLEIVLDSQAALVDPRPDIMNRFLVSLQTPMDFDHIASRIGDRLFEDCCLKVEQPDPTRNIVIAKGDRLVELLTPFYLKLYFQSTYADGEEVVSNCYAVMGTDMVLVCFEDDKVARDVLKRTTHIPLPSEGYEVTVEPFYRNVQGYIPQGGKLLYQVIDEIQNVSNSKADSYDGTMFHHQEMWRREKDHTRRPEKDHNIDNQSCSEHEVSSATQFGTKETKCAIQTKDTRQIVTPVRSENTGQSTRKSPPSLSSPLFPSNRKEQSSGRTCVNGRNVKRGDNSPIDVEENHNLGHVSNVYVSSNQTGQVRKEGSAGYMTEDGKWSGQKADRTQTTSRSHDQFGDEKVTTTKLSTELNRSTFLDDLTCPSRTWKSQKPCPTFEADQQILKPSFGIGRKKNLSGSRLKGQPDGECEESEVKNAGKGDAPQRTDHHLRKPFWKLLKKRIKGLSLSNSFYDDDEEILTFESLYRQSTLGLIEDLEADVINSEIRLSQNLLKVFETNQGKKYLKFYWMIELDDYVDVTVEMKDNCFLFYGFDVSVIEEVKKKVQNELMCRVVIDLEGDRLVGEVEKNKDTYERQYKVYISWNPRDVNKIEINGVSDDVNIVKNLIQGHVEDSKTAKGNFVFSGECSVYVMQNCQENLKELLQTVDYSVASSQDAYTIFFSGKLKDVNKVTSALAEMDSAIKTECIDVINEFAQEEAKLIIAELSLLSPDSALQYRHNLFMSNRKCSIFNILDDDPNDKGSLQSLSSRFQSKKSSTRKAASQVSSGYGNKDVTFILNTSMKLKIKIKGNIIREKSDVLVCVLHNSRQLSKTDISKAFLTMFNDLQTTVDALSFSSGNVELSPISSPTINCKAIAFALLTPHSSTESDQNLQQLILEVLMKAKEFGANSVSFPPIGLGKVMGYSESVISENFFLALKVFVEKTAGKCILQKVKFLASGWNLYRDLGQRGKKFFKKVLGHGDKKKSADTDSHVVEKGVASEQTDGEITASQAEIRILHRQPQCLAAQWKKELKDHISHEDMFDTKLQSLPKKLDEKIKNKQRCLPVVLEISKSKSGHCVYKMSGSKSSIRHMKAFIAIEIAQQGCAEVDIPAYWNSKDGSSSSLYNVGHKVKEAIKNLLLSTWDCTLAGQGNDAKNIPPNVRPIFISVQRIENPSLFKCYAAVRSRILSQYTDRNKKVICKSVSERSVNGTDVSTYQLLPKFMKQGLFTNINEHYMFHGTKLDVAQAIIQQNCKPNLSNASAMFGKGVYTAESSLKSDQYTDDPKARLSEDKEHYLFLVRVVLGDIFVCDQNHPSVKAKADNKFVQPPCKKCDQNRCTCGVNYDSIMGEGNWLFREFVVYEHNQCYPEYLIKYKRGTKV